MPGKNFFLNNGDKDTTELSQRIRIGTVTAVDTDKATVTIDWLDKSGSRTEVPLNMPFLERGWGMMVMPKLYATVVCAMRPYDFPVIIAYLPPNFMHPKNYWTDYKFIANLTPDVPLNSGEIVIRNLIGKAKCDQCKKVYTLAEWAATYTLDKASGYRMEQCPNPDCRTTVNGESIRTPAVLYYDGRLKAVYKIQMGILIYLQETGKLRIKMNDGLDATDTPDKGSLIDINLDELGNFEIKGVKDFSETMSGNKTTIAGGDNIMEISGNLDVTTDGDVLLNGNDGVVIAPGLPPGSAIANVNQLKVAMKTKAK